MSSFGGDFQSRPGPSQANEPDKAIPHFSAAFKPSQQAGQKPVDAVFCETFAYALAAVGKKVQAIDMFQLAADRGGARADVFGAIGSLYAQLDKWDEARPQFERALSMDNSYVLPRIHLGILYRQQLQYEAALSFLGEAVALEPANALAQFEYGRTLEAVGQDEAATPHLEEAIKLNSELPDVQNELAMALQRQGRQQEAIPWFRKALERLPDNVSVSTNLGLALTLTGKAKEGINYFQHALAADPRAAVIHKDLGVAHVQLSAFDDAIADFQAALALDPNDPQLHYDLGLAYKFKDRVDDAIAELSRAGQMDPTLQAPLHVGYPLHAGRATGRGCRRVEEGRGPPPGEWRCLGDPGQHAEAGLPARRGEGCPRKSDPAHAQPARSACYIGGCAG